MSTANLSTDNWVTIVGSTTAGIIVAIGWFVSGYLNRKKEVDLKRMEYRLAALHDCLPIVFAEGNPFAKPEFAVQLADVRCRFQLYGTTDEIGAMERFISAVEQSDVQSANTALGDLSGLVRTGIRRELAIGA